MLEIEYINKCEHTSYTYYIYTFMCTSLINRVFNYDFQHAVYTVAP